MADQNLIAYILRAQSEKQTREQIYKDLLTHGWNLDDIQAAFTAITNGSTIPRPPQAPIAPTPVTPTYTPTASVAPTGPVAPVAPAAQTTASAVKGPVSTIVTIGALLVAAGVFSFIAANWDGMTRPIKMAVILIAMIAVYMLGWYLKESKGFAKTGESLYLLGTLIYGSGIFLVAQIFNIRANWPDGFILWMLGALVLGLVIDSYPVLWIAVIVGIISVVSHPFVILDNFGHNAFLMTSSILLLIAAVATIWAGLRIRKDIPEQLTTYL
ncbi:MAG TPA: DUF2157 domain-containing protein [Candidatus Paceibacterota bacterium]